MWFDVPADPTPITDIIGEGSILPWLAIIVIGVIVVVAVVVALILILRRRA